PDDRVPRRVEDAVQREGQLHDTEVRRQVAAGLGDVLDEELANLGRQLGQLLLVESLQIRGRVDIGQQGHESLTSGKGRGCLWNEPFGDQLEYVRDAQLPAAIARVRRDMNEAAGVVGGHDLAASLGDRV